MILSFLARRSDEERQASLQIVPLGTAPEEATVSQLLAIALALPLVLVSYVIGERLCFLIGSDQRVEISCENKDFEDALGASYRVVTSPSALA
jgi:hypothetical protein